MRLIPILFLALMSCASNSNSQNKVPSKEKTDTTQYIDNSDNSACLKGTVMVYDYEFAVGATVRLENNGEMITGAIVDVDGKFKICTDLAGDYTIRITYAGYKEKQMQVKLTTNKILNLKAELVLEEEQIMLLKPILYFYPNESTQLTIELNVSGGISHSYPKYDGAWNIQANADGTLFDSTKNRSYYGLYWEGNGLTNFTLDEGFVVKGSETIGFLETSLKTLGLNDREANEFIVYWLPILESKPYNLIHFSSHEYEEMAKLKITPQPETIIRVMMVYQPLNEPIEITPQDLNKLSKERKGFTVVEWGGSKAKSSDIVIR